MDVDNALTVIAPRTLDESERMAKTLSRSALLSDSFRGNEANTLVAILTGAELGLAPMQALRGIQVIKGKPCLSADTMGALVKRRRDVCEFLALAESTDSVATYETKRAGDKTPTTLSFTIEQAKQAGLTGGDNWRKYPAAMLRARALSAICRAVYPDLCLGLYDPDELADHQVTVDTKPSRSESLRAKVAARLPDVVVTPVDVAATAETLPPFPEAIPSDENMVVCFGEKKGTIIASLTNEEIGKSLFLGESRLREDPNIRGAKKLKANIEALRAELDNRIKAESETNEPGSEG